MAPDLVGAFERIRLYRPASGSEGADFMARWCGRCAHDEDGSGCRIAADTMIFRVTDPQYPAAWRQDGPSGPRCSEFEALDQHDQPLDPAAVIRPLL